MTSRKRDLDSADTSMLQPKRSRAVFNIGNQEWVADRIIGSGAFSTVFQAHKADDPSFQVALKMFKTRHEFLEEARTAELIARGWKLDADLQPVPYFSTALAIHPSVEWTLAHPQHREGFVILYKKAWGSLAQWRRSHTPTKLEVDALFESLYHGMMAMHELGYAHRDLKPDNVLVYEDRTSPIGWAFVFGDLGSVCGRNSGNKSCASTTNRTTVSHIPWTSKPTYKPDGSRVAVYGYRSFQEAQWVDMYGLGCILHFMITGTDLCLNNWFGWRSSCYQRNLCDRSAIVVDPYPDELESYHEKVAWMLNVPFEQFEPYAFDEPEEQ